jgi:hypothetical protein
MDATFRSLQRSLAERLGALAAPPDAALPALEIAPPTPDAPRLVASQVIEKGGVHRAWRVDGEPGPGFGAFLDGTQRSHVVTYVDGVPIVAGTVAAVVRRRIAARLGTWGRGPVVRRRLYAPRAALPPLAWQVLAAERGVEALVDTTAPEHGDAPIAHPFALAERAVHLVQADRERAELELAEHWCTLEHEPLFMDGGISGVLPDRPHDPLPTCLVGVVKSHRTLHVDGDALRLVLGLRRGFRSSVFRVVSSRRRPVASWYLRLRDPAGRDPMWGLVRVEAADHPTGAALEELSERADEVSRWILAESAPLALPDARWDKMVYGIRDCEEFLRAVC